MATSTMPQRHGRPNESDTMTGTSTPKRDADRVADRAWPSRRGRAGSSVTIEPDPGPTFEASTPPLAQTKPCGVSVMSTPFSIRTTRRASRRTTSIWRASRSKRSANSTASARGTTPVRSTIGALGLRDDLLGDDQHVIVAQREGARAWRSMASPMIVGEVVADADLGDPVEGEDRDRAPQPTPRRSGAFERSTRTRSSGVSRSMVSGDSAISTYRAPAASAAATVGGPAARPERGLDDVGRPEGEGVRAGAVAVGDEDDDRAGRRPRRRHRGVPRRSPRSPRR